MASIMAPVEMARTRETTSRLIPSCATSNGNTISRPIRIASPYGSSRATDAAAAFGRIPTKMRPPSRGGSGNRLNTANVVHRAWTYLVYAERRLAIGPSPLRGADGGWYTRTLATDYRALGGTPHHC